MGDCKGWEFLWAGSLESVELSSVRREDDFVECVCSWSDKSTVSVALVDVKDIVHCR